MPLPLRFIHALPEQRPLTTDPLLSSTVPTDPRSRSPVRGAFLNALECDVEIVIRKASLTQGSSNPILFFEDLQKVPRDLHLILAIPLRFLEKLFALRRWFFKDQRHFRCAQKTGPVVTNSQSEAVAPWGEFQLGAVREPLL